MGKRVPKRRIISDESLSLKLLQLEREKFCWVLETIKASERKAIYFL